jgi:dienelactone hydrolase
MIASLAPNPKRVSEQAIVCGAQKSLVGILTQPTASTAPTDRPAVVILNTGIIHRVGHNRMYVALSRTLAMAGYTVVRFDFSGIGDSAPRAEALTPLQSSLADIRETLDWLETVRHASRVILIGLCSGADYAVLYGPTDPRVVGLILLDPTLPPTFRYYLKHVGPRLLRLSSWLSVATGKGHILTMLRERVASALARHGRFGPWSMQNPKVRSYVEKTYQTLVESGIEILAVFTAGPSSVRQNYREQLFDAFPNVPFEKKLRLEYFEDCDHTFVAEADRGRLTRAIMEWIDKLKISDGSRISDASALR